MAKQQHNQSTSRTQPLKATWRSSMPNHATIPPSSTETSNPNPLKEGANRTFLKAHSKSGPFLQSLPAALSSKRTLVPKQQGQQPLPPGTLKIDNGNYRIPGIQVPMTPEPMALPAPTPADLLRDKIAERRRRIGALVEEIQQTEPLCDKPLIMHSISFHNLVVSPSIQHYAFHNEPLQEDFAAGERMSRPASSTPSVLSRKPSLDGTTVRNPKHMLARASSFSSISLANASQPEKSQDTDRINFVRLNTLAAKNVPTKLNSAKVKSKIPDTPSGHTKGQVPKYLERRKAEWAAAEEEKRRNQPDPECPPGHVLMPESERQETLELLQRNYDETAAEINKMPVRNDTLRIRARREELDHQLLKLEEGIRILSRPKVFVKLDT